MFRLAHLTDTHLLAKPGATLRGVDPGLQFERVVASVARFHPDLVLLTGDLAHDGEAASYRALHRALAPLNRPVLAIPGNHDQPAVLEEVFGRRPIVSRAGAWRIVLLNTRIAGRIGGSVRAEELEGAAKTLARTRGAPLLLALHHPPVSLGSPWLDVMELEGADRLAEWVTRQPALRLILSGHVHQAAHRKFAGRPLFTSPSTCVQFAPGSTRCVIADRRPAWRALWLQPDGSVQSRVRRLA